MCVLESVSINSKREKKKKRKKMVEDRKIEGLEHSNESESISDIRLIASERERFRGNYNHGIRGSKFKFSCRDRLPGGRGSSYTGGQSVGYSCPFLSHSSNNVISVVDLIGIALKTNKYRPRLL